VYRSGLGPMMDFSKQGIHTLTLDSIKVGNPSECLPTVSCSESKSISDLYSTSGGTKSDRQILVNSYQFCCLSRRDSVQKLGEGLYVWFHAIFLHLFKESRTSTHKN
jgi:hypothetical protein